MTFAWPAALLGLLLVPLAVAGYLLAQRRRQRYAVRFTNLDLLASVVTARPRLRRHVPAALALLALTALLLGLARPQHVTEQARRRGTVMLAVDVSGSMNARDVRPTRIAAAKSAARAFVEELPRGFDVGVVAFASGASVRLPPTGDRRAVYEVLAALRAGGGTALGDAIERSLDAGLPAARRRQPTGGRPTLAVLLLSDGKNTEGSTTPQSAAKRARRLNVPVYTIALGTPQGTVEVPDQNGFPINVPVPPDPQELQRIASITRARSFTAPSAHDLQRIYANLGTRVGYRRHEQDIAYAFAGAGAVLLLISGALSALWFGRLP